LPGAGTAAPGEILACGAEELLVACGQQALGIRSLQREGGKRLGVAEFLRGFPLEIGQKLLNGPSV
jgi:methionyl-tRNA formyltransferase